MVYYHPHGLGDLIMAMPYVETAQKRDKKLWVSVKPSILKSGFFDHYPYKSRVSGDCPIIWDKWQLRMDREKLDHQYCHTINPDHSFGPMSAAEVKVIGCEGVPAASRRPNTRSSASLSPITVTPGSTVKVTPAGTVRSVPST